MRKALENTPAEEFARPEGLIELDIDPLSGKLPTANTPNARKDIFAPFNTPTEYDDVHVLGTVLLHSEKRDDPAWEDPVRAWAEANGYAYPSQEAIQDASTSTSIIFP